MPSLVETDPEVQEKKFSIEVSLFHYHLTSFYTVGSDPLYQILVCAKLATLIIHVIEAIDLEENLKKLFFLNMDK